MRPRILPPPPGYAPEGAASVALWAAALDEQSQVLAQRLAGVSVDVLEWQLRPGTNSMGMLLAHLAVAEAYWMQAGVLGHTGREDADRAVRAASGIGMADDGMPIAPGGGHPETLRGWTLDRYTALLGRTRAATHAVLRTWADADLERTVEHDGTPLSRAWILFHVADHFAHHAGQIALLQVLWEPAR